MEGAQTYDDLSNDEDVDVLEVCRHAEDAILKAFENYIDEQDYFDIACSKKTGCVWIAVDEPGAEQLDTPEAMLDRNRFMVEHASTLLAVYNGVRRSGTGAAVNYAKEIGREIIVIDPNPADLL